MSNDTAIVNTTTGEIVERDDQIVSMNDFQQLYNTIDTNTWDGKVRLINSYNNAESMTELGSDVFTAVDIFTTNGIRRSRVPGVDDQPCVNAYVITDDGKTYFTQSTGIVRGLELIVSVAPDLNKSEGGVKLRVTERKLSNGNTLKGVEIVTDK